MKALIKKMLFESLIRSEESLELIPINDISDDDLYDSLVIQSQNLKNQENISFNGSLYSVIFNPKNFLSNINITKDLIIFTIQTIGRVFLIMSLWMLVIY